MELTRGHGYENLMEFPTNYFMINNEEQESVSSDWERIRAVVVSVREEAAKVIVGQADVVDQMLVLFCARALPIVGVPGLAKTLLVGTLGRILGLDFKRIQFTPDLMPPDILGSEFCRPRTQPGVRVCARSGIHEPAGGRN